MDFYVQLLKRREITQGRALLRLQNLNLILNPYLSSETVKFWPKTGQFFSTENA